VIGMGAAIDFVQQIGWSTIQKIEGYLLQLGQEMFSQLSSDATVFGQAPQRVPIFAFAVHDVHAHDVGAYFDDQGVAVRTGYHCTQPIIDFYGQSSLTRASFSLYNLPQDVYVVGRLIQQVRGFMHGESIDTTLPRINS